LSELELDVARWLSALGVSAEATPVVAITPHQGAVSTTAGTIVLHRIHPVL